MVSCFSNKKLTFILIPFLLIGCAERYPLNRAESGIYYQVKKGDTLSAIAEKYKINIRQLAEVNRMNSADTLAVGKVLFIPNAAVDDGSASGTIKDRRENVSTQTEDGKKKAFKKEDSHDSPPVTENQQMISGKKEEGGEVIDESHLVRDISAEKKRDKDEKKGAMSNTPQGRSGKNEKTDSPITEDQKKIKNETKRFVFPVEGKVVTRFGLQPNGLYFNGVRIAARDGSAVNAAADGMVIFSDNHPLSEFGEAVIIKHDDEFSTVYTNLTKRLVKRDDQVKKGNRIATVAKSETKASSYMSFEIRLKNKAMNPLSFFPDLRN